METKMLESVMKQKWCYDAKIEKNTLICLVNQYRVEYAINWLSRINYPYKIYTEEYLFY